MHRVCYDQIASVYDQRYAAGSPAGLGEALLEVARVARARRILEVGCGTGHWLGLFPSEVHVCGLDLSLRMLLHAKGRHHHLTLMRGDAHELPCFPKVFDLIYCVNALHHFDRPEGFVRAARETLRPGGALAIVGMDPHAGRDRWYLYEYFPGTYTADLRRYPSQRAIQDWISRAGFCRMAFQMAARIQKTYAGAEVFTDPILRKQGTSQLALLSDEAFARGMKRIDNAIRLTAVNGKPPLFVVDIHLPMVVGWVPAPFESLA